MRLRMILASVVLCATAFLLAAQTPQPSTIALSPGVATVDPTNLNLPVALAQQSSWTGWADGSITLLGRNQKDDETTISALGSNLAALKMQQDTDRQTAQTALAAAFAKDATSLQSCPSGQTCSFTLPACDISGVYGADPNILHGPTQASADPTFPCKAGWMQPGERLYYTQYVPLAGLYAVSASVASVPVDSCPATKAGSFHLEIAGVRFPADGSSIPVPRTATWSSYQTLPLGQIQLSGGITKFAFVNDSPAPSCFDLSWIGMAK